MKTILNILGGVLVFAFFFNLGSDSGDSESSKKGSNSSKIESVQQIRCARCNKDLTNDYNRMNEGSLYYCTAPCYQILKKEASDILEAQGYDRID
jgi:late competence protein required for DNA uptake (superfamily II DNA/RNA helicase)